MPLKFDRELVSSCNVTTKGGLDFHLSDNHPTRRRCLLLEDFVVFSFFWPQILETRRENVRLILSKAKIKLHTKSKKNLIEIL